MRLLDWFKNSDRKEELAPEVQRYLDYFKIKLPRSTPITNLRFVILDTETTGLNVKKDRILSIGAVAMKNYSFRTSDRYEHHLCQAGYSPDDSIQIHGITINRTSNGIEEKEAIAKLFSFLRDSILVGHHIGFDKGIIEEAMIRHFGVKIKNKTLDTSTLEKRLISPFKYQQTQSPPSSLDSLCKKYKVEMVERHTAAGDAFITALVFMKQLARLEAKGVRTMGDLLR